MEKERETLEMYRGELTDFLFDRKYTKSGERIATYVINDFLDYLTETIDAFNQ